MSQTNNPRISVTLTKRNWPAIQSLIRSGCQQRDDRWVRWGRQITNHIQAALDAFQSQTKPEPEFTDEETFGLDPLQLLRCHQMGIDPQYAMDDEEFQLQEWIDDEGWTYSSDPWD